MNRTDLTNGVTVWYESDTNGTLILRYPDGSQVRTTWNRLGLIEAVVDNLRDLYEYLLLQAGGEAQQADPPVDKLVQLDDLLFALEGGQVGAGRSREGSRLQSLKSSPVF